MKDAIRLSANNLQTTPGKRRFGINVERILTRSYGSIGHRFYSSWFRKDHHGSHFYANPGFIESALALPWYSSFVPHRLAAHATPFESGRKRGTRGARKGIFDEKRKVRLGVLFCIAAILTCSAVWNEPELAKPSTPSGQFSVARQLSVNNFINKLPTQDLWIQDDQQMFLKKDLGALMKEFGAEEYAVPPEFVTSVDRYIRVFQNRDRSLMASALVEKREIMDRMREVLRWYHVPEDLAYMALIESNLMARAYSGKGAAGWWQFTKGTALDFGMKITRRRDDRLDISRSTEAAGRYMRELILEFGNGSSVMLAMAAYNSGPQTVRRAVRTVVDPIKQRNFWYLYSTRALPEETRQYVPKIMAAIVIGRNPGRFGFNVAGEADEPIDAH